MKRVLTAVVGVPIVLAAVFGLPELVFFLVVALFFELGVWEYVRLTRYWADATPVKALMVLVPFAALILSPSLLPDEWQVSTLGTGWVIALVTTLGVAALVLFSKTPIEKGMPTLGVIAFGLPYLALPIASIHELRREGPWVLILLLAVVWIGDTAAFYVGRTWGRHRLAPRVSPKKTWEGAWGGLAAAVAASAVWSLVRLGEVRWQVVLVAVATAVAAQIGDLAESLIKRGAGVKDSGNLLPGHGGVLDRIDAILFAAPMMLTCVNLLGEACWKP